MDEKEIEKAWAMVNELKDLERASLVAYLRKGELLKWLSEKKKYRILGTHVANFTDFLKEIGVASRSKANRMIRVYERLGKHMNYDLLTIPSTRLETLINSKVGLKDEEMQEWLFLARDSTSEGFIDAIRERTGVLPSELCDHAVTEAIEKCTHCGKMRKLHVPTSSGENSEQC